MKAFRYLQMLLTVLPVITAGLYLLGLCYHYGYLSAFGIDDSLFPLPSDKALFYGFFSLAILSFPAVTYAIAAMGAFIFLIILMVTLASSERMQSLANNAAVCIHTFRIEKNWSPTSEKLVDRSTTAYLYATGLVIIIALLILIATLSIQTGKEQAMHEMDDYLSNKASSVKVRSPQMASGYIGKLIFCGDNYCAFWSEGGSLILRHDLIDQMIATQSELAPKLAKDRVSKRP